MITSSNNQQMKHIVQLNKKAKTRYEQRVFVVEGIKLCMEAPKDRIRSLYVAESFLAEEENVKKLDGYSYEVVSDSVFRTISDTQTPQGILGIIEMPEYSLEELLGEASLHPLSEKPRETSVYPLHEKPEEALVLQGEDLENASSLVQGKRKPHLLILESIQDPGNLGTMVRTGEGAGITGIIMNKSTVDMFHPKTIRSTMGSIYRVPFYITEDLPDTLKKLKEKGVFLYAAHLKGTTSYDQPDYTIPTGFLIGNEGNGLSDEIAGLADEYIRIPMEGKVESLNAAIAATLLMYEVNRQRR